MPPTKRTTASEATTAMEKLSISHNPSSSSHAKTKPKAKKEVIVDSWEDEESGSSESEAETDAQTETETETKPKSAISSVKPKDSQDGISARPPTPPSPSSHGRLSPPRDDKVNDVPWIAGNSSTGGGGFSYASKQDEDKTRRPEKTDAVARRLIAGSLGLRVPKQTEEQKAYNLAVREKERKRLAEAREAERKRQEEAQRIKAAMWDD